MRKAVLALLVLACVLSLAIPAYCGCGCSPCSSCSACSRQLMKAYKDQGAYPPDHYEGGGALKKLGRGEYEKQ